MRAGRVAAFGVLLAAFLFACLPRMNSALPESGPILVGGGTASPSGGRIEFQYLGVAGWRIETPHTVLLTAPLLSRPSIFDVGLGRHLEPDSAAIHEALAAWEVGPLDRTVAILSGHGHYDHLLDVPWFATRIAPRARILTNTTSRLQLLALDSEAGLDSARVVDVSGMAASTTDPGTWISLSRDVRVMPVRGDHAPHAVDLTLYSGVRRTPLPRPPGPASDWLDGSALAFLVDVLDDRGRPAFRFYFHDATPREPAGTLPDAVLSDGRPVDAAFLVPASFADTRWHPEVLVQNLRPGTVVMQHWEDFFVPALDDPEPVIFLGMGEFIQRLGRVMECDTCYHLPRPGARIVFPLGTPEASAPLGAVRSRSRQ